MTARRPVSAEQKAIDSLEEIELLIDGYLTDVQVELARLKTAKAEVRKNRLALERKLRKSKP